MKKLCGLFILLLILYGCNSTKRLTDEEVLLTKNHLIVDGSKNKDEKLSELISLKPNNRTLGIPLALYLYNIGNKNNPKTVEEWAKKKPKKYERLKKLLSEKQSIAYANSMIGSLTINCFAFFSISTGLLVKKLYRFSMFCKPTPRLSFITVLGCKLLVTTK